VSRAFPDTQHGFWNTFCQEEGLPIGLAPIYAKLNGAALFSPPPGIHPNEFTQPINLYYRAQKQEVPPIEIINDWERANRIARQILGVSPQNPIGTEAQYLAVDMVRAKAEEILGPIRARAPLVDLMAKHTRDAVIFAEMNGTAKRNPFMDLLDVIFKGGEPLGIVTRRARLSKKETAVYTVFAPKAA